MHSAEHIQAMAYSFNFVPALQSRRQFCGMSYIFAFMADSLVDRWSLLTQMAQTNGVRRLVYAACAPRLTTFSKGVQS